MANSKLDSLIALLDDPDSAVIDLVMEEILKEDIAVVDHLERIWETSLDEVLQQRIELAIRQIQLNDTKKKIRAWSETESIDLFEGMFLISRYHYPELKLKPIQLQLNNIRKEVWLEFRNSMNDLEKITILNHIFFTHYKFKIERKNPGKPQLSYINRILETHRGNAVSISCLYVLIARSLDLPVYYIDFQNNHLLGYFQYKGLKDEPKESVNQALYYINPANKGAIIGPKEIDYILHSGSDEDHRLLNRPCTDRTLLKRLLEELIRDYKGMGATGSAVYLNEIAEML